MIVDNIDIGLQFALNVELNAFLTACRKAGCKVEFAGSHVVVELENSRVLILASGVGLRNALRTAELLVDMGAFCIISSGIAGAVDRRLRSGDIVVAKRVLSEATHGYALVTCDLPTVGPTVGGGMYCVWCGDIVTSRHIVRAPEEKYRIHAATGAVAVDMESYAIGELCKRKGIKFAVIRAVADTADEDLTGVFKNIQTSPSLFGLVKQLASHPASLPQFIRLYSQVVVAVRHLAEFLVCELFRKYPEEQCHQ